jgi:dTDP-4-dehydrorhamnose reductase
MSSRQRVLVTGANGQLGIEACALLEEAGHTVLRTDVGVREGQEVAYWDRLDITCLEEVQEYLAFHKPDAILHGAAYTDVDGCERNPELAYRVNMQGTWNLAALARERDLLLTYISTDFVFDGEKHTPYTEEDAPNPLSHYGASKLAGERKVSQLCPRHFIVRTAWLYGIHGKNFPRRMLELAQTRKELSVVGDQIGSPTHVSDLARKLVELLPSPLYGTYHVSNNGFCSWYEFAKKTLEFAGVKGVAVRPILSTDWASPTQRPTYSVLRNFALELQGKDDLPHWEESLCVFVERLQRSHK